MKRIAAAVLLVLLGLFGGIVLAEQYVFVGVSGMRCSSWTESRLNKPSDALDQMVMW